MLFSARLIFFSPADVRIGYYHPYYAFVLLVPPTLSIKNRKIKYEGSPRIWWDMIVAEGQCPRRQKSVPRPGAPQLWPEPLKCPKSPRPYLLKAVYSRLLNVAFQARKSKDNYADKFLKIVSNCFLFLVVFFLHSEQVSSFPNIAALLLSPCQLPLTGDHSCLLQHCLLVP